MQEPFQMIHIDDNTNSVQSMRIMVSAMMKEWQNCLLTLECPKKEDYASKEEYENACKDFMIELIDEVKEIKKNMFINVLNFYHKFIEMQRITSECYEKEKIEREEMISKTANAITKTGLLAVALSLALPEAEPYTMGVFAPLTAVNLLVIRKNKKRIERNLGVEKRLEELHTPIFELTSNMRMDYNKTKEELEKLKEKVKNGENVMEQLLDMFNPEKLKLEPVSDELFRMLPFEEVKQFKKENR